MHTSAVLTDEPYHCALPYLQVGASAVPVHCHVGLLRACYSPEQEMLTSAAPSAVLADQPCDRALQPCMSMSVALPRVDVLTCNGRRQ